MSAVALFPLVKPLVTVIQRITSASSVHPATHQRKSSGYPAPVQRLTSRRSSIHQPLGLGLRKRVIGRRLRRFQDLTNLIWS